MRLIVTEKDSAARKIADILGGRVSVHEHGRGRQKVRSYGFEWDGAPATAIGLRGHVMESVFPNTLPALEPQVPRADDPRARPRLGRRRRRRRPRSPRCARRPRAPTSSSSPPTTTARASSSATRRSRSCAARRSGGIPDDRPEKAKKAATRRRGDDRLRRPTTASRAARVKAMLPEKVVDRHHRARYSALTPDEVKAAFAKPVTVDFNLAEAAHSRQDIDLIWGAVLTRFMSLASYRYGSEYLSVGRVQTPTLRLIVDRELERRAFVPVPYWEVKARLRRDADELEVAHATAASTRSPRPRRRSPGPAAPTAVVTGYKAQPRTLAPPPPFNTTALMSAASAVGVSPARAMRAAESLYLDGLISYPRTDNTVYPPSLDLRAQPAGAQGATRRSPPSRRGSPAPAKLTPTRGKKRTTDHPPIYPVGVPRRELRGDQAKVYDLVVRRFLATLLPAAVIESQRVDVRIGSEPFVARGSRVAKPGFLEVYERVHLRAREAAADARGRRRRSSVLEVALGGQGDPAAEPLRPGPAHREDGRPRPRHQGDPRRHHPAPLRPQLRARQPGRADRARHRAHRRLRRGHAGRARSTSRRRHDRRARGARWTASATASCVARRSSPRARRCWSRRGSSSTGTSSEIRERIKGGARDDLTLGVCKNCGGELRVLRGKTGKRFAACVGKPEQDDGAPRGRRDAAAAGGRRRGAGRGGAGEAGEPARARGAAAGRRSRSRSVVLSCRPGRPAPSAGGPRSR